MRIGYTFNVIFKILKYVYINYNNFPEIVELIIMTFYASCLYIIHIVRIVTHIVLYYDVIRYYKAHPLSSFRIH